MNLLNKVERDSVLKNNAEVRGPRSEVHGGVSECECESESEFDGKELCRSMMHGLMHGLNLHMHAHTHIHIHTSDFLASDVQR